jgi:hypothetical protein
MGLSVSQKVPTGRKLSHLGVEHSPVALWTGDSTLADSSGNGFALGVDRGTELYGPLGGGLAGFMLDGATRLGIAEAALKLSGDMTLQCLARPTELAVSGYANMVRCEGPESYIFYLARTTNADASLYYYQTNTAGSYSYFPPNHKLYVPAGPVLLGFVRGGGAIQMYVDGSPFGPADAITGTIDSATTGVVYVGENSSDAQSFKGTLGSIKIVGSALTDAQMYSEAERVGVV